MTVITCVWGSLSQLPLCPQIPLRRTGRGRLRLRAAGADGERRHSQQCSYLLGCHGGLKTSWNKKKGKKRRKPRLQNGVGIDFFFLYVFFFSRLPALFVFPRFFRSPGLPSRNGAVAAGGWAPKGRARFPRAPSVSLHPAEAALTPQKCALGREVSPLFQR